MEQTTTEKTKFFINPMQNRIHDFRKEKGFTSVALPQQFLQMIGEANEAYEEWRRENTDGLAEELADVAIYAYGIASMYNIDLGEAINQKLAKNAERNYTEINGQIYEVGKADTPVA